MTQRSLDTLVLKWRRNSINQSNPCKFFFSTRFSSPNISDSAQVFLLHKILFPHYLISTDSSKIKPDFKAIIVSTTVTGVTAVRTATWETLQKKEGKTV